jgi:hypothetical protein
LQIDSYLVTGDALVPPAQCPPCGLLGDSQLVVVPAKSRMAPDGEARPVKVGQDAPVPSG